MTTNHEADEGRKSDSHVKVITGNNITFEIEEL